MRPPGCGLFGLSHRCDLHDGGAGDVSRGGRATSGRSRFNAGLRPLASKRDVALVCFLDRAAARAYVDSTQIEQALSNLVMNAIRAISEGGTVRVQVATAHRVPPDLMNGPGAQ